MTSHGSEDGDNSINLPDATASSAASPAIPPGDDTSRGTTHASDLSKKRPRKDLEELEILERQRASIDNRIKRLRAGRVREENEAERSPDADTSDREEPTQEEPTQEEHTQEEHTQDRASSHDRDQDQAETQPREDGSGTERSRRKEAEELRSGVQDEQAKQQQQDQSKELQEEVVEQQNEQELEQQQQQQQQNQAEAQDRCSAVNIASFSARDADGWRARGLILSPSKQKSPEKFHISVFWKEVPITLCTKHDWSSPASLDRLLGINGTEYWYTMADSTDWKTLKKFKHADIANHSFGTGAWLDLYHHGTRAAKVLDIVGDDSKATHIMIQWGYRKSDLDKPHRKGIGQREIVESNWIQIVSLEGVTDLLPVETQAAAPPCSGYYMKPDRPVYNTFALHKCKSSVTAKTSRAGVNIWIKRDDTR